MSSKFIQSWLCTLSTTPLVPFRTALNSVARIVDLSGNTADVNALGAEYLVQLFGGSGTYAQLQFMKDALDAAGAAAAIVALGGFSATPSPTGIADGVSTFYHIPNNQGLLIDLPHNFSWFSARADAACSLILTRVDERGVR